MSPLENLNAKQKQSFIMLFSVHKTLVRWGKSLPRLNNNASDGTKSFIFHRNSLLLKRVLMVSGLVSPPYFLYKVRYLSTSLGFSSGKVSLLQPAHRSSEAPNDP